VDEFGKDSVLIVSNTSGAAGEEEQVCQPLTKLSEGKGVRKRPRCFGAAAFHKGTIPALYFNCRNQDVMLRSWITSSIRTRPKSPIQIRLLL
jgi:hypothetical protein